MKTFAIASLLAGIGYALPQQAQRSCETVTETVTEPTSTNVRLSTYITLITATTPEDWGTATDLLRLTTTVDLVTLTSTETDCTATGTITAQPTTTVYTTAEPTSDDAPPASGPTSAHTYPPPGYRRDEAGDGSCTITETSTRSYGVLYTHSPAHETSTWTRYTDHTIQTTVTETRSGFTSYNIVTATATTVPDLCGPTVDATAPTATTTATLDARCAPSAMASAAGFDEQYRPEGYGIDYASLSSTGAEYETNATSASACCQLCADKDGCAASAWDSRTDECKLSFPVGYSTGELSCGTGFYAFWKYGPAHPLAPGAGLYVAELCGTVSYFSGRPDDGT